MVLYLWFGVLLALSMILICVCVYVLMPTQFLDLRVAVLGNVDSGKSTLLGVLTQGELDNGRGRARLNLFRHLHEIQSGRTSSISFEILGFNSKGEVRDWGFVCIKDVSTV